MDPKTLSNLDPKLRETYERVMGTAAGANTSSAASPASPSAPPPQPADTSAAPVNTEPPQPDINPPAGTDGSPAPAETSSPPSLPTPPPSPSAPTAQLSSAPTGGENVSTAPAQTDDLSALQPTLTGTPLPETNTAGAAPEKLQPLPSPASVNQANHSASSPSPLIRTLYFVAGIIFFIVYAIFWLKIFNYPLPF